jgi:peptidoglycan hydrolase-like protein with peptidoglycan-binding domain
VSAWQERVNDLNVTGDVRVDGMFNSNDAAACRIIQEHYGIQVDGVVGPQTWAATFAVGSNGADLHGAYRLPLAIHRTVNPRNVYADGADAGANPQYDPSVLRVEADIDFGAGISKSQARRSASAQINRDYPAGWTGSVTLAMDPQEGSRFDVQAGQNIRVAGWGGSSGVLLHIAQVSVSLPDSSVSLQVDQKARDALTLAAIIDRKADNASNPTRLPPRGHRRSAQVSDTVVEFDGE